MRRDDNICRDHYGIGRRKIGARGHDSGREPDAVPVPSKPPLGVTDRSLCAVKDTTVGIEF